ncbi:MAG: hypothetical protein HYU28_12095 [Actinobacteria bacterium]|nr:hypothetical protein [Actinomycetota bacterium]
MANDAISKLRIWAGVSESGFYEWRSKSLSATAEWRTLLAVEIRRIFRESDGATLGRWSWERHRDGVNDGCVT